MGTPFRLTVYAADTLLAHRAIDSVFQRIEALEQSMSDYRPDSEINQLKSGRWQAVSEDLFEVLRLSRRVSRRSGGAFDVTIGPLTKLWRRAIRRQTFPGREAIERARSRVQWKWVKVKPPNKIKLNRPDIQFDLGGIAKGYALDAAAEVLRHFGIEAYLIDGGGDLLLGAPPPGRAGWRIETPTGGLDTARVAVVTSGNNYRYLTHDGRRYGHIINPRTGLRQDQGGAVTVIGPRAAVADGWASATVVDYESRKPRAVRFNGKRYRVYYTNSTKPPYPTRRRAGGGHR